MSRRRDGAELDSDRRAEDLGRVDVSLSIPPVAEFHDVTRARFEAEVVPAGRPAVRASGTPSESDPTVVRARLARSLGD